MQPATRPNLQYQYIKGLTQQRQAADESRAAMAASLERFRQDAALAAAAMRSNASLLAQHQVWCGPGRRSEDRARV